DLNAQGQMLICEDPNSPEHNGGNAAGDAFWAARGNRDASVWLYDTTSGSLVRIAQIDRATAAASVPSSLGNNPGVKGSWETSGVIDVSALYGPGAWIIDVQAHTIMSSNPLVGNEGGQLLMLNTNGPIAQLDNSGNLVVFGTAGDDKIKIVRDGGDLI